MKYYVCRNCGHDIFCLVIRQDSVEEPKGCDYIKCFWKEQWHDITEEQFDKYRKTGVVPDEEV